MEEGGYWVALFNRGGESAGVERELAARSCPIKVQRKCRQVSEPGHDAVRSRHGVGSKR